MNSKGYHYSGSGLEGLRKTMRNFSHDICWSSQHLNQVSPKYMSEVLWLELVDSVPDAIVVTVNKKHYPHHKAKYYITSIFLCSSTYCCNVSISMIMFNLGSTA
jgi:hypothetical protein